MEGRSPAGDYPRAHFFPTTFLPRMAAYAKHGVWEDLQRAITISIARDLAMDLVLTFVYNEVTRLVPSEWFM